MRNFSYEESERLKEMANESEAAFQMPQRSSDKGQMMLIYLPEGSVIVDRTNVDLNDSAKTSAPQANSREEFVAATARPQSRNYRGAEHIFLRRRHRMDWVHSINVAFASYVAIISLVPIFLSSIFGVSVFIAKSNNLNGSIHRGQLLVSHMTPIDRLGAGDVILLRSPGSWKLQVREVTDKTTIASSTTISSNSGVNTPLSDVFTLENHATIRYVTSLIPFFGFVAMFATWAWVKILVVFAVLTMNVVAYFRRRRLRTHDEKMVYIAR